MEFLSADSFAFIRRPLFSRLNDVSRSLLLQDDGHAVDFTEPRGEPALSAPDSVAWRIFKNPVSLFIGGIAAVLLELAEPRVRTGVWEHSGFRQDPAKRLRRTGLAAMVTVYGARSIAERMIGRINRIHECVQGKTPSGEAYSANDPELLNWVHATAAFGFLQAYHAYVAPLTLAQRNCYYGEGGPAASLYGVTMASRCEADVEALFKSMRGRLERSPIIFEFLEIMHSTPLLPSLLVPIQPLLVGAAVGITPAWVQEILGLSKYPPLKGWQQLLIAQAGAMADRVALESSPAVQACLRLGLPANYLYKRNASDRI